MPLRLGSRWQAAAHPGSLFRRDDVKGLHLINFAGLFGLLFLDLQLLLDLPFLVLQAECQPLLVDEAELGLGELGEMRIARRHHTAERGFLLLFALRVENVWRLGKAGTRRVERRRRASSLRRRRTKGCTSQKSTSC